MKSAVPILLGVLISLALNVHAECRDGHALAEEAVREVVASPCLVEAFGPTPSRVGENYLVNVSCGGPPQPTYAVHLFQWGNGNCAVIPDSVQEFRVNAD